MYLTSILLIAVAGEILLLTVADAGVLWSVSAAVLLFFAGYLVPVLYQTKK